MDSNSSMSRSITALEEELAFSKMDTLEIMAFCVNVADHLLIGLILLIMTHVCNRCEFRRTALHTYLCTLGFVCFVSQGMMVSYKLNPLAYSLFIGVEVLSHFLLMLMGGVIAFFGVGYKIYKKPSGKHFVTRHGKIGLVAMNLFCISCIVGVVSVFIDRMGRDNSGFKIVFSIFHTTLGLATYLTAMLAQFYGYECGFFLREFDREQYYKWLTFVILAFTLMGPFSNVVVEFTDLVRRLS